MALEGTQNSLVFAPTRPLPIYMSEESTRIKQLLDEIGRLNARIERTELIQDERNRLEQKYWLGQQRFRKVFDESAVGKKIIDDQLYIVKANKAFLN